MSDYMLGEKLQNCTVGFSHCGHLYSGKLDFFRILDPIMRPKAEFKEFEPRLKYGWFHLKLYSMFQNLSRLSIVTGFGGFELSLSHPNS